MVSKAQKEFALQKAVELTCKALESTDKVNQVAYPTNTTRYLETVYAKLLELQEGE